MPGTHTQTYPQTHLGLAQWAAFSWKASSRFWFRESGTGSIACESGYVTSAARYFIFMVLWHQNYEVANLELNEYMFLHSEFPETLISSSIFLCHF